MAAAAGWLRAKGRIAAAGTAAAACITVVVLWSVSQAPQDRPGLRVEDSDLYVRYALVTNPGPGAGYAYVLNTGDGKVHRSPSPVQPGQSWKYSFDRDLKNGAQICGYIDMGPATCTSIHA